jgi:hypothetical protein
MAIVQDPERLSRNTDQLLRLLQMFQDAGLRVEFATGGDSVPCLWTSGCTREEIGSAAARRVVFLQGEAAVRSTLYGEFVPISPVRHVHRRTTGSTARRRRRSRKRWSGLRRICDAGGGAVSGSERELHSRKLTYQWRQRVLSGSDDGTPPIWEETGGPSRTISYMQRLLDEQAEGVWRAAASRLLASAASERPESV